MRSTLIILFLFLFYEIGLTQYKMEAYFGQSNRMDYARDILEFYDKGYLISAGYEWETGWNIKTDKNLQHLWDKTYEFPSFPVFTNCAINDSLGNTYICGAVNMWPFVAKIDPCGNKLWCKILQYENEFNYGSSNKILITGNDEILLLTYFDSDEEIALIHLIGLSLDGDVLWKKPYASKNDYPWIEEPYGFSIIEFSNDYYISGYCYWPYPDDTTHLFLRPMFIGIDSIFNEKWVLPFAPLDSVFGEAFKSIPVNDTIIMGIGERWLEDINKNTVLMFYSDEGETLGYNQIPNDSIAPDLIANVSRDIQRINDSLYITFSVWGSTPDDGICSEMIIDTSGKIYKTNESKYCIGDGKLIKTYDQKFVYSITVEETKSDWDIYVYKIDENLEMVPLDPTPHNYDSLCPDLIQSGTTDLSDCFVWTDIGDAPSPKEYYSYINTIPVKAYPNPTTEGTITFEFENTEHHSNIELKCFNVYGKMLHSEKVYQHQVKSIVTLQNWKAGLYIGLVYSYGKIVGRVKFLVRK